MLKFENKCNSLLTHNHIWVIFVVYKTTKIIVMKTIEITKEFWKKCWVVRSKNELSGTGIRRIGKTNQYVCTRKVCQELSELPQTEDLRSLTKEEYSNYKYQVKAI